MKDGRKRCEIGNVTVPDAADWGPRRGVNGFDATSKVCDRRWR